MAMLLISCGGSNNKKPSNSRYQLDQDTGPDQPVDLSQVKDAIPKPEPRSRYGNPSSYVVFGKRYYVQDSSKGHRESGIASWYGKKFHGHRTSSGETYDMYTMTAAHKTLPLPTYVRVKNLKNGRTAIVKVNDRGPFHANRIIDLSYAAAHKLGYTGTGTAMVEIVAIDPQDTQSDQVELEITAPPQLDKTIRIFIQTGAFSSRQNADNYRKQLQGIQSYPVHTHSVERVDKPPIYRVVIGPFDHINDVDMIIQKLENKGISPVHTVFQ